MATVAVIGALQLFDQASIAGGPDGDPNNALMTVVLYLYNAAFTQFNFSYAAAVGVILFVRHLRGDARAAAAVRRGPVMVSDGRPTTCRLPQPCAPEAAPTSPARARRRRRAGRAGIAYVLLIGYALLMFIPFAWSVITSFKTLPDSVKLTFIPDPFTLEA